MEAYVKYKDWVSQKRNDWKPQTGDKVHVLESNEISKQGFTVDQFSAGLVQLKGNRHVRLESLVVKIIILMK